MDVHKISSVLKRIALSDEKLWTKPEWEAYKKQHPDTKIKPKFNKQNDSNSTETNSKTPLEVQQKSPEKLEQLQSIKSGIKNLTDKKTLKKLKKNPSVIRDIFTGGAKILSKTVSTAGKLALAGVAIYGITHPDKIEGFIQKFIQNFSDNLGDSKILSEAKDMFSEATNRLTHVLHGELNQAFRKNDTLKDKTVNYLLDFGQKIKNTGLSLKGRL